MTKIAFINEKSPQPEHFTSDEVSRRKGVYLPVGGYSGAFVVINCRNRDKHEGCGSVLVSIRDGFIEPFGHGYKFSTGQMWQECDDQIEIVLKDRPTA